jgi:hypothetical protein
MDKRMVYVSTRINGRDKMQVSGKYIMRRECMDCGKFLGYKACSKVQHGLPTHGLCDPCFIKRGGVK